MDHDPCRHCADVIAVAVEAALDGGIAKNGRSGAGATGERSISQSNAYAPLGAAAAGDDPSRANDSNSAVLREGQFREARRLLGADQLLGADLVHQFERGFRTRWQLGIAGLKGCHALAPADQV